MLDIQQTATLRAIIGDLIERNLATTARRTGKPCAKGEEWIEAFLVGCERGIVAIVCAFSCVGPLTEIFFNTNRHRFSLNNGQLVDQGKRGIQVAVRWQDACASPTERSHRLPHDRAE